MWQECDLTICSRSFKSQTSFKKVKKVMQRSYFSPFFERAELGHNVFVHDLKYLEFKNNKVSQGSLLVYLVLCVSAQFIILTKIFDGCQSLSSTNKNIIISLNISVVLISTISCLFLAYLAIIDASTLNKPKSYDRLNKQRIVLEGSVISSGSIYLCSAVFFFTWHLGDQKGSFVSLSPIVAMLVLRPIILPLLFRKPKFKYILLNWLLCLLGMVAACTAVKAALVETLVLCITLFVGTLFVILEQERQNLKLFFATKKLQLALAETEQLTAEEHASEMRFMIGNVAHDLKTVII